MNADTYKVKQIDQMIQDSTADEYNLARLKGDNTKTINIGVDCLKIIKAYYEGKVIQIHPTYQRTCLNCGAELTLTDENLLEDEWGTYAICPKCSASFDVDREDVTDIDVGNMKEAV